MCVCVCVHESVRVYICMYVYKTPKKCGTPRRCAQKPVVRRWKVKQGILDLSLRFMLSMRSMADSMRGQGFLYSSSSERIGVFSSAPDTFMQSRECASICNAIPCMACVHSEQHSCADGLLCSKPLPGGISYRICEKVE